MNKLFVGMGEALWDMLPAGKQIGGAPANFAYHAGQLGYKSVAVSAVGKDAPGSELIASFERIGLHYLMPRVAYPTGTVDVSLDAGGVPCYDIREQVAWDYIPLGTELRELAARTDVFCFGTLAQRNGVSRTAIRYFLDRMPDGEGRLKVLDINLRQHYYGPELLKESLDRCNVLKLNDDEYAILQPVFGLEPDFGAGCRTLLGRYGLKAVVLTCGATCSHIFTPDEHSYLPTPRVEVADTVGAGDAFTAAFCASLLAGKGTREAHRLAVEVAAFVCTQPGAMPEIPRSLKNRLA